jgi:hypothetical protein
MFQIDQFEIFGVGNIGNAVLCLCFYLTHSFCYSCFAKFIFCIPGANPTTRFTKLQLQHCIYNPSVVVTPPALKKKIQSYDFVVKFWLLHFRKFDICGI